MTDSSINGGAIATYIQQEIEKATRPLHQRVEALEQQLARQKKFTPPGGLLRCLGITSKDKAHD